MAEMARAANMLGRVTAYAIRRGSARDIAFFPKKQQGGDGMSTSEITEALNHKNSATSMTLARHYVGGHVREFYNERAANKNIIHRKEPKFSNNSAHSIEYPSHPKRCG
ncbi:hypothetical protein N7495_003372 [Penicillium taxi]|uniref:uncharacterized protein n=1 Tax=Penicillium taxi TaxID=168475 RepID=UPI002545787A|nr:uncharacterized protein N7495_003372 [Penicillium taxi]KAJ5902844.1 hypothetical protein N7495_003372 [Penicillium taxi]